jgi:cyclic beta-1,2-glucan synthetase
VYGEPPHVGRAGWKWYTGSSGWMLRVVIESLLGFDLDRGRAIRLRPRLPSAWPG